MAFAREIGIKATNIIERFYQMIGNELFGLFKPESRELVEHQTFIGDAGRENEVEGGDAVGGNNEEEVTEVIGIPHLATDEQWQRKVGG